MLRFWGYFVFDFGIKGLLKFVIFINVMFGLYRYDYN